MLDLRQKYDAEATESSSEGTFSKLFWDIVNYAVSRLRIFAYDKLTLVVISFNLKLLYMKSYLLLSRLIHFIFSAVMLSKVGQVFVKLV